MKKIFDIILFENMIMAYHHLKDVAIIADMFSYIGKEAVICNLYGLKDCYFANEGIPIYKYKTNRLYKFCLKNTDKRWGLLLFLLIKRKFLSEFLSATQDKTRSYYVGSYGTTITSVFLKSKRKCYFWGLRSYTMDVKFWLKRNPLKAYMVWKNKKLFLKGNNYLFVSNKFIEDEFEKLGVPRSRMILREERIVKAKPDYKSVEDETLFKYLLIGQLRPDKRVELVVKAFNELNDEYSRLYLIGISSPQYEPVIRHELGANKRIIRYNKFVDESMFNKSFIDANCTVFADKRKPFSVTNGTLMESLINFRPVIVPNYNPYKYYVEKYGVGVLYEPENPETLVKAMREIKYNGTEYYKNNISEFLKTLCFERVASEFGKSIDNLENV